MKKKLTKELLKGLKNEGYTALIGAGQLANDEILFTPSKEPIELIIDSANYTPFEEDDIIILTDDDINDIPEDYLIGEEVEI